MFPTFQLAIEAATLLIGLSSDAFRMGRYSLWLWHDQFDKLVVSKAALVMLPAIACVVGQLSAATSLV